MSRPAGLPCGEVRGPRMRARPHARSTLLYGVLTTAWALLILAALAGNNQVSEYVIDLGALLFGPTALGLLLLRRHARLGAIFDRATRQVEVMASAQDALPWECDQHGNLLFAGPLLRDYFGYEPHELTRLNLRDVVHPSEHARLARHVVAGEGWRKERWLCLRKDGTQAWFSGSAVPRIGAEGRLLGYTGATQPLRPDERDELRLSELTARVHELLDNQDFVIVFQPILSVATGRLVGAEALSRFPASERSTEQWFADAAEVGLGAELELATLRRALTAATRLPRDVYVSLNVGPDTLTRPALLEHLRDGGVPMQRLVLELTEHASIREYDDLLPALGRLRAAGVRLAVDDAGAGYASFRHILRLAPEFIKLDRSLIAGIHDDPALRALASAVVTFGQTMHATIVGEGIELREELRCLQSLGIDAAQGYLLGRPTDDWSTWTEWHEHGALYRLATENRA